MTATFRKLRLRVERSGAIRQTKPESRSSVGSPPGATTPANSRPSARSPARQPSAPGSCRPAASAACSITQLQLAFPSVDRPHRSGLVRRRRSRWPRSRSSPGSADLRKLWVLEAQTHTLVEVAVELPDDARRERNVRCAGSSRLSPAATGKSGQRRTVRLLGPLASDLSEWRLARGRPDGSALVFPGRDGAI